MTYLFVLYLAFVHYVMFTEEKAWLRRHWKINSQIVNYKVDAKFAPEYCDFLDDFARFWTKNKMGINSTFKEALERATSQTLLEPDWAAILQVCDSIRQQDVPPKVAVSEIKKRIFDSNPHVSKNALITLEACVKNCGVAIHDEVATRALMEDFRQYITICPETNRDEILRIIQAWAYGFRNNPKYKIVEDTRNLLRMEGYSFPERSESDAMFSALKAPDWADGEVCHRCRVKFATFKRQHHCRCCGQVFCGKCSSKLSTIAKFGIEREVRVCDPCFDQLNPGEAKSSSAPSTSTKSVPESDLPQEYLKSALSKESQIPEKKSDEEIKRQEQDDLQLAMALSVSEQEGKPKKASSYPDPSHIYDVPETKPSAPAIPSGYIYSTASMEEEEDDVDPELARYLNRSYWENRKEASPPEYAPTPSEPQVESPVTVDPAGRSQQQPPASGTGKFEPASEEFLDNFQGNIDKLMQRMMFVTGKGKHVSQDTITQTLFQSINAMHPQLLNLVEQQEQEKEKYEALRDKLDTVEETRHSLDAMRTQRKEKLRQQELEQDMLRRMQMEQKMELLRQQKQEYMLYQQQLQVQRQQEQRVKAEQAMAYQPSTYGMHQPSTQFPAKTSMPADSYPQAGYNPAGPTPPAAQQQQYQPTATTQPPAYQTVVQQGSQPPGPQRQTQPHPPYPPPNQYDPATSSQYNQKMQPPPPQSEMQPASYGQPASTAAGGAQPAATVQQPYGMQRPQNPQAPPPTQALYPQGGSAIAHPPAGMQSQAPPQARRPVIAYPDGTVAYIDDGVVGSPQAPDQGYPSSGPLSYNQGQSAYNRTPPSSGPPSLEMYSSQAQMQTPQGLGVPPQHLPPQQQGLPPQTLPPQQPQNLPPPQSQPPQQNLPQLPQGQMVPPPQNQPPLQQPHPNLPPLQPPQATPYGQPPNQQLQPPPLPQQNFPPQQINVDPNINQYHVTPLPHQQHMPPPNTGGGPQQSWNQAPPQSTNYPTQPQQPVYGGYEPVQQQQQPLQQPLPPQPLPPQQQSQQQPLPLQQPPLQQPLPPQQQPQQQPLPPQQQQAYGSYEPTPQAHQQPTPYGQAPPQPQQYYDQRNITEAQLISFD